MSITVYEKGAVQLSLATDADGTAIWFDTEVVNVLEEQHDGLCLSTNVSRSKSIEDALAILQSHTEKLKCELSGYAGVGATMMAPAKADAMLMFSKQKQKGDTVPLKGESTLTICHAAVVAALQAYIGEVGVIRSVETNGYGATFGMELKLEHPERRASRLMKEEAGRQAIQAAAAVKAKAAAALKKLPVSETAGAGRDIEVGHHGGIGPDEVL